MIATLIPYFLVCNISGDSGWQYGPEYIYNVQGNITRELDSTGTTGTLDFDMAMRCRPKNTATLSCVFKNTPTHTRKHDSDLIPDSRRFEINFNEIGADNFTAPGDMNIIARVYIRRLAPLLTVGSDWSGKNDQDGVFHAANSNVAGSKMNLTIEYPPETEEDKPDNLYELEILPEINKPTGKAIEITKETYEEVDGAHRPIENQSRPDSGRARTSRQRIEEMMNRLKISKHSFESYVYKTLKVNLGRSGFKNISEGHARITLAEVVPADEPIPEIEDPTIFSIVQ